MARIAFCVPARSEGIEVKIPENLNETYGNGVSGPDFLRPRWLQRSQDAVAGGPLGQPAEAEWMQTGQPGPLAYVRRRLALPLFPCDYQESKPGLAYVSKASCLTVLRCDYQESRTGRILRARLLG
jgi:hypothetical protein